MSDKILQPIAENTWKFCGASNFYARKVNSGFILIDTGARSCRRDMEWFFSKLVPYDKVRAVLFTHLHHDHAGNFDLFPHAVLYASRQAIDDLWKDPAGTILDSSVAGRVQATRFQPIEKAPLGVWGLELIPTPGHTKGSVCLYDRAQGILFSGDTIFAHGVVGRVDLPTSDPQLMEASLKKLVAYPFSILAAGHDVGPADTPK